MTFERDQLSFDNEQLRNGIKALQAEKEKVIQDQHDEIERLKSQDRKDAMTKEVREYHQKTSNDLQSLIRDNDKLRQKLVTSEEQCKLHRQQASKLREMIQKRDIGYEVDDSIITARFRKLAEQIQRIIRTSYKVSVGSPAPKGTHSKKYVKELHSYFQLGLTPNELQNRVRGLIFSLLELWIILRTNFGLAEIDKKAGMEDGLTKFELLITENASGMFHWLD